MREVTEKAELDRVIHFSKGITGSTTEFYIYSLSTIHAKAEARK